MLSNRRARVVNNQVQLWKSGAILDESIDDALAFCSREDHVHVIMYEVKTDQTSFSDDIVRAVYPSDELIMEQVTARFFAIGQSCWSLTSFPAHLLFDIERFVNDSGYILTKPLPTLVAEGEICLFPFQGRNVWMLRAC